MAGTARTQTQEHYLFYNGTLPGLSQARLTQVLTAYTFFIHLTPLPTSVPHDLQTSKNKWHPQELKFWGFLLITWQRAAIIWKDKTGLLSQIPSLPRLGDIFINSKQEINLAVSLQGSKWQEGRLQDEQSGAERGRPLESQGCGLMRPAKERHNLGGRYFQTSCPPLLPFILNMF